VNRQAGIDKAYALYIEACAAEGRARGAFDAICEFGGPLADRSRMFLEYEAASAARATARRAVLAAYQVPND